MLRYCMYVHVHVHVHVHVRIAACIAVYFYRQYSVAVTTVHCINQESHSVMKGIAQNLSLFMCTFLV